MEQMFTDTKTHEIGVVFSFILKKNNRESALAKLDELISLADTAGVEIVDKFHQELLKANRTTLIGKGKVEELAEYILENKIDVAIFDNDLSPMQQRNLAEMLKCKVIDRSGLIKSILTDQNIADVEKNVKNYSFLPNLTFNITYKISK